MDHPAVQLWRDRFRLNLSASWKHDVEITVTDLSLWQEILDGWFYFDAKRKKRSKAPGIKNLLTEYERLSTNHAIQQKRSGIHRTEGIPERPQGVLPKLEMPSLLERQRGWQG
jgi:hypothetical protein